MRITRQIPVAAAIAVVVGIFLYWYGNKHDFFDLKIYMSAVDWWRDGHRLYDYSQPDRVQGRLYFTYPPFAALLLGPFGLLPLGATIGIFTALTVLAYAVTTWWLVVPLADRFGWPRGVTVGIAVPLVLAMEQARETATFGQINMLLIVLVLADLLFAVPRKSRWAGVGIGLATAIKLVPGIFIVYLLITRRWRAAAVSCLVAAAATLFTAAVAPRDSWQFWTGALWDTDRVGRTDYTGNQSLLGLLSRLVAPEDPSRALWLVLALAVGGFGLWRAARAAQAGDEVAGLTLAGLVGALVSPITWPHHLYWFVPAIIVLVRHSVLMRQQWWALAAVTYAVSLFGVVSFVRWGVEKVPTDTLAEFVGRNLYVLWCLVLVAVLPTYSTLARTMTDLAEKDSLS